MADKDKDASALIHKFFFTEVVGIIYDRVTNKTNVICANGTEYSFLSIEACPRMHDKVSITVEFGA